MSQRRYTEEEVALILRRAVDEAALPAAARSGEGLTLRDLEEIGAEVGIDPARIRAAATTLDRPGPPPTGSVGGVRTVVQLERTVPVRLEDDDLPVLLDLIRDAYARQGRVEEVLGGFEWRARSALGGRYVSIRPEGDVTRIRVLGNFRDGLMGFTLGGGPMLAAALGALVTALGSPTALLTVPVALAGGAAAAMTPWRYLFRREEHTAHELLERLDAALRERAEQRSGGDG